MQVALLVSILGEKQFKNEKFGAIYPLPSVHASSFLFYQNFLKNPMVMAGCIRFNESFDMHIYTASNLLFKFIVLEDL